MISPTDLIPGTPQFLTIWGKNTWDREAMDRNIACIKSVIKKYLPTSHHLENHFKQGLVNARSLAFKASVKAGDASSIASLRENNAPISPFIFNKSIEIAVEEGHLNIFQSLLEEVEADDRPNVLYSSALQAIDKGHLNILKYVLELLKNSQTERKFLSCAERFFCRAAKTGYLEMVQYLYVLAQKPDLGLLTHTNTSTLLLAATRVERYWDVLLFLLENGRQNLLIEGQIRRLARRALDDQQWDFILFLLQDCIQWFDEEPREENRAFLQSNLHAVSCAAIGKDDFAKLQQFLAEADEKQLAFSLPEYIRFIEISLVGNSLEMIDYLMEQLYEKFPPPETILSLERFISHSLQYGNVRTLKYLLKRGELPLTQKRRTDYLRILEPHLKSTENKLHLQNLLEMCWFLSKPSQFIEN